MPDNLPALNSRPFIAPRMSAGMKAAIGFLIVTGILVLGGMVMTMAQIMQRLDGGEQDNVAAQNNLGAPAQSTTTLASAGTAVSNAYPVIGHAADGGDRLLLPQGAVVQQLVPSGGGVYLLVDVPHEGQRIIILDAKSGGIRRDIRLQNDGK